jgi:Fur family peroxide stress response transcriptional regulator
MANRDIIKILTDNNLRITPQRTAVLEVLYTFNNHPSADYIIDFLRLTFPHITLSTVYKILDVFIEIGIITRVKTEDGIMRYDYVNEKHHHLYCTETERIENYYDEELDKLLENYMKKKTIPNFKIKDIRLQITGTFTEKQKNEG